MLTTHLKKKIEKNLEKESNLTRKHSNEDVVFLSYTNQQRKLLSLLKFSYLQNITSVLKNCAVQKLKL